MKKLDSYLSNLLVGFVKLHNIHWNVIGMNFKPVHEYLENIYDNFSEKYDEIAEYQKMNGIYPKASLKNYLELSSVEEIESKDYSCKEAIEIALELIKSQKKLALEIREETEDFNLSNMMESHVEDYNKKIWFIENMLK